MTENLLLSDVEKLSKDQLLKEIRSLQSKSHALQSENDRTDMILHELQVHQIELEMQNRALREAQQQLEETRDSYADLYDFAPVNYLSFDEKGYIRNINLTGASLLGKVRANIIDRPFIKWLRKDSIEIFRKHLKATLKSDMKNSDELQILNDAGEVLEVRIESIRNQHTITGDLECRSVVIDMTESNRIKNKLFLQARQLKLITDALPVLIAYIDIDEQHLFANRIYADTFGFFADEILGKKPIEIWGEQIYTSVNKFIRFALAGQQINFDMELPLDTNEKKYFHATLIPDIDNVGNVYGVIVLIGDITDRLAIEALDRKRLLEIAHISRLSTMGEMASEIAHELNQPLAAITIYSDACRRILMSGKDNKEKIIQSLSDISTQAERAGDVIRRIREFTSKKLLDRTKLDFNELVQSALQLLAVEIRSHNVKLALKLANDLPAISVDKILIEQVIFNLARNALEAMDDVEPSLRKLRVQTLLTRSNEIEVSIHDSGPGLKKDSGSYVFEAFYTTKDNGMGMGLAISQSIIESHHGRLWYTQNNHGGTTFCFTLPLLTDEG